MIEFKPWGKTPRLNRDIIITEKIDGTNSAVIIAPVASYVTGEDVVTTETGTYRVGAQSRNRLITPGKTTDNYGFAAWVQENAEALASILGKGHHFGEWWGQGIARNYGQDRKRFSLFNVDRYVTLLSENGTVDGMGVVPELYRGPFDQLEIENAVYFLREDGSWAAPSWGGKAEGIIVFHTASRQVYKVLCENDDLPKSLAEVAA